MESCLIVAGEQSGEEHALSFFPLLKELDPQVDYFGVGGEGLQKNGVELIYHLRDFSSWGVSEVVEKIPFYFRAMQRLLNEVEHRKCKTALLIDFQTFNLTLAQKLKKRGVNVLYYVAPQAWAWKAWRTKYLEKSVHTLFTIIPFEKKWFQERGVKRVVSVKHPLLVHFESKLAQTQLSPSLNWELEWKERTPTLLLLPGSRNSEVRHLMPVFLETINKLKADFPKLKTAIVWAPTVEKRYVDYYSQFVDECWNSEQIAEALKRCHLCLASSGTVTLLTALFERPTVVCYRSSLFNSFLFHTFINYRGPISLTNIVHEQKVFPEYLQDEATGFNMSQVLKKWLTDQAEYEKIKAILRTTKAKISGDGLDLAKYFYEVIKKSQGIQEA